MIIFVLLPKMMIVTRGHNATVNKIIVLLSPRVLLLVRRAYFQRRNLKHRCNKKKEVNKIPVVLAELATMKWQFEDA